MSNFLQNVLALPRALSKVAIYYTFTKRNILSDSDSREGKIKASTLFECVPL